MDIRYRILCGILAEDIFLGASGFGAVDDFIAWLDDLVWGPWMLALLLGCGCYLMVRMDFFPVKNLRFALKCALGMEEAEGVPGKRGRAAGGEERRGRGRSGAAGATGKISSLSSLTTELATTLGIGNIVGVASAMVLGGPGALFWMVATSVIGLATKLAESMLAVKYRGRNDRGEIAGGPMYTCRNAFPHKRLGRMLGFLFALFAVTASIGMGNMTQSNSIADALWVAFSIPKAKTGLYLTVLTVLVVIGGIGVIGKVTQVLVPFMGVFYLCGAFAVILVHWRNVPVAVGGILTAAFCPQAVSGGIFGSVTATMFQSLRWGVSRGIFSNEAGLGTSAMAHGAAQVDHPARQGMWGIFEVFFATMIICTVTALVILTSGVYDPARMLPLAEGGAVPQELLGAPLTVAGFATLFGEAGEWIVSVSLILFAFTSLIGSGYYGRRGVETLTPARWAQGLYQLAFPAFIVLGAVGDVTAVWQVVDVFSGLLAVVNLPALLLLSPEALYLLRVWLVGQKKKMEN